MSDWQTDKVKITELYLTLINLNNIQLYKTIKDNRAKTEDVFPLIEFILSRLSTVIDLARLGKIWDAEIILRSATETTLKFLFIVSAESDEYKVRLNEYWNDLAEIDLLKVSEQAKKNLSLFPNSEIHKLAHSPNVLSYSIEKEIRFKWTKIKRQKLEQKWSFTEIANSLSKKYHGKPLEMFLGLTHGYRMASHVSHGDEIGLLIIKERNSRSQSEQDKVNFAHYLRVFSDTLTFCALISIETSNLIGIDNSFFYKNIKRIEEMGELLKKYESDVYSGPEYDSFRNKQNNG